MKDDQIIQLYFSRSEDAIKYTDLKYGAYCKTIAFNILNSRPDSDECVNDTYLQTWNSIPPTHPYNLKAYLGKITRNISLNRMKARMTQKRCISEYSLVYNELDNILEDHHSTNELLDELLLKDIINKYLDTLPKEKRIIFVARYWYFESIKDIAKKLDMSESKVKMSLSRIRDDMKIFLKKEGVLL